MHSRAALSTILIAMLCLAIGGCAVQPSRQEDSGMLTLVTLNLWHDKGDWPKRERLIVAALRDLHPDVITLQEVFQHEGLPNQAKTRPSSWYAVSRRCSRSTTGCRCWTRRSRRQCGCRTADDRQSAGG